MARSRPTIKRPRSIGFCTPRLYKTLAPWLRRWCARPACRRTNSPRPLTRCFTHAKAMVREQTQPIPARAGCDAGILLRSMRHGITKLSLMLGLVLAASLLLTDMPGSDVATLVQALAGKDYFVELVSLPD